MAHECPTCYATCHCDGDIDDICFDQPEHYCTCCEEDDDSDEEPGFTCSTCGYLYDETEHEPGCSHYRE